MTLQTRKLLHQNSSQSACQGTYSEGKDRLFLGLLTQRKITAPSEEVNDYVDPS